MRCLGFSILDPARVGVDRDYGRRARLVGKGGSWADRGCGGRRTAARCARPADLKHILIGFRLIREVASPLPEPTDLS
jgi:formylglycine-generating enzyme required for sulfatase activity